MQSLFDYLEGGDTLDEFLRQFPSVRRKQAVEALEVARRALLTSARDENLPRDLAGALTGHAVSTVQGLGWTGTQNGALLKRAGDVCTSSSRWMGTSSTSRTSPISHSPWW